MKQLLERIERRECVAIDVRHNDDYLSGHIPGSMNAPYHNMGWGNALKSWLGDESVDIIIIGRDEETVKKSKNELESIGLSVSAIISDNLNEWHEAKLPLSSVIEISPEDLYKSMGEWIVIDVREPWEWQFGTISGSIKIPLNELPKHLMKLDRSNKYAIVCAHGNRSEIAAIYLSDNNFRAATMVGGIERWMMESLPLEYEND
jgi:rhodanese-related sulfurtransferase